MYHLSTATKLGIARALYRSVRAGRVLAGRRSDTVECRREGITWHLDLRDGIQLSIYLFGRFERVTARALERILPPGGIAIDIGANIGAHALPMARRVGAGGRIVAIEPTQGAFAALSRNIALNPTLAPVIAAYQAAVLADAEAPSAEIYSTWPLAGAGARHAVHGGALQPTRGAIGISLDTLVAREGLPRVDVIKIDIDGGEVRALTGGRATLREFRPMLVLELCPYALEERGDSLQGLLDILDDTRYQLLDQGSFRPLSAAPVTLARDIPSGGSINIVACPRERPVPGR